MTSNYLRYPDIRGDLVTFVAADDVWLAPASGGRAWRLSADNTPVENPVFSPDGSQVAWMSTRDGHQEVMVAPIVGGAQRRLTYFGAPRLLVLGWTADSRVLVATSVGEPNRRDWVASAVSLTGEVEALGYGPVSGLALHPDGPVALATPYSRPPALWKRYRGGTAPRLWLLNEGQWDRLLPDDTASLVSPGWVGNQLIFASDRAATFPDHASEQANLYAMDALGDRSVRQITRHSEAEGYVRDPRTDGSRVVYHSLGRLWVLDSLDAAPRRLDIELVGGLPSRAPLSISPTQQLTDWQIDQHGDASLIGWRGRVVWLPHRDGPARVLAGDSGVRRREPRIVPGSDAAVWAVTGPSGDDRLELLRVADPAATPVVLADGELGRVLDIAVDPEGRRAAVITHDGRILSVPLDGGAVTELATSPHGEASELAWSPDGRYLVWSQPAGTGEEIRQLMVASDGAAQPLTSGRFDDFSPRFTSDGKYLAFLSSRTFDPAYDEQVFDLGFVATIRPFLAPLDPLESLPFGPSIDGWRIGEPDDAPGPDTDPVKTEPPVRVTLGVDGFEERIAPFPVPSADYRDLQTAKDGVLWIRESAERGELGTTRAGAGEKTPDVIEFFSFVKRCAEVVVDKATQFAVSADGRRMVVRVDDSFSIVPADRKLSEPDDPDSVDVDLSRLRAIVDRPAEWRQMYVEAHRLMAQHYWRADMNGVDWDAVGARYAPVVDRIASHDDFTDVLWETVGELNTSHAYVMPPDGGGDGSLNVGHLGADFSRVPEGWRIDKILPGESSDPEARSPLRAAGVAAQVGDVLVAVDDQVVDARGPNALLLGAVNRPVSLTLKRGDVLRRVAAVPIASETALRYQGWVRGRTEYVAEQSGGRLGYVHVPDMVASGWAQFHRNLRPAMAADGVIVDIRNNSGGHTSQLVLGRVMQEVIGWDVVRHQDSVPYPSLGRRGPIVFVTNEHAGSDGDIIAAAAKETGVGPVVGVRSWGGVVGIDGRFDLVDGTEVTQPRFSFWFRNLGWDVENWGVDPDIVVEHSPADFGVADRQLDRAISELLDRLAHTPPAVPPALPEPRVRESRFDSQARRS